MLLHGRCQTSVVFKALLFLQVFLKVAEETGVDADPADKVLPEQRDPVPADPLETDSDTGKVHHWSGARL